MTPCWSQIAKLREWAFMGRCVRLLGIEFCCTPVLTSLDVVLNARLNCWNLYPHSVIRYACDTMQRGGLLSQSKWVPLCNICAGFKHPWTEIASATRLVKTSWHIPSVCMSGIICAVLCSIVGNTEGQSVSEQDRQKQAQGLKSDINQ